MAATADLSFVKNYGSVRDRLYRGIIVPKQARRPEFDSELICVRYSAPIGPPHFSSSFYRARYIRENVAVRYGFNSLDLCSERRPPDLCFARSEAMYYVQVSTTWGTPRIGKFFGGRDHTSVIHAIRKYEAFLRGEKYERKRSVSAVRKARIDAGEAIAPGAAVGVAR